jgi:hypothetical protein
VAACGNSTRWCLGCEYGEKRLGEDGCEVKIDVPAPPLGKRAKDRPEEWSCEVDIDQYWYREIRTALLYEHHAQRCGKVGYREVALPQMIYVHSALCI